MRLVPVPCAVIRTAVQGPPKPTLTLSHDNATLSLLDLNENIICCGLGLGLGIGLLAVGCSGLSHHLIRVLFVQLPL